MPQQHINIGTNPNDGTGTPWRQAWQYVNEMFTEVYLALGTFATSAALTAESTARSEAVIALNEALASKVSADAVAGLANLSSVVRRDTPVAISNEEKAQHAENAGTLVTLAFKIIDISTPIYANHFPLPPLPKAFYVKDANLVIDRCEGGQISAVLINVLSSGQPALWTNAVYTEAPSDAAGLCPATTYVDRVIPALGELYFEIDTIIPDYLAADSYGLTLWVRGVWVS